MQVIQIPVSANFFFLEKGKINVDKQIFQFLIFNKSNVEKIWL